MKFAFYPCLGTRNWNKNGEFDFSNRLPPSDGGRGLTLTPRQKEDFKMFHDINSFISWLRNFDVDHTTPLIIENVVDCELVFNSSVSPVTHGDVILGYLKEKY